MEKKLLVSVICTAYNHENYIGKCLDGFVMQQTEFAFEVLINEDASTDRTADIIREYERKYPDIIKPIYQTENQYSQGVDINTDILISRAQGKYIAICEGDDFWTDPEKMQKQVNAMEAHPEVDMCAHSAQVVNEDGETFLRMIAPSRVDRILTADEVIRGDGAYLATNSLLFRREVVNTCDGHWRKYSLDYTWQMIGAMRGGIWYLADCMSAYRFMARGSWTERTQKDQQKLVNTSKWIQSLLQDMDNTTNGMHHESFAYMIRKYDYLILQQQKKYKQIIAPQNAEFFRQECRRYRLYVYLQVWCPWVLTLKHRLFG